MLEIPAIDSSITASIATVKRYAPPNQRNRSLGRRKSGGGWMAALNAYNNLPYDSPERPVMYTKRSPWGHAMLPHQLMSQAGGASSSGLQKDFLSELQLAIHGTSASSNS
ncbi:uncharacterized protein LOC107781663 isoform X2 [Nicotiana tabacum]|uniref:Uncharacterized protein LOC107781663 isoform X2 n=1 Tax=Nicotiana tabacum TaxID=4097 RepID=A0AC58SXA8_TOBAC|nr:uncharacterized protein LOC104103863 isoform X2 [Nicotiana tomentosiformis]